MNNLIITSIREWKHFNENILSETILVPRNIESRKEKLRQQNIKLLSQEVIEGDLEIDESFEGIDEELVKVKEIKGYVWLKIDKGYIPKWLKDVKICDSFVCFGNNLTSLENCPQYIGVDFNCSWNNLTSLKGCPQYLSGNFNCSYNKLTSLEGCPKYIGGKILCFDNKAKLELPKDIELKGEFNNV